MYSEEVPSRQTRGNSCRKEDKEREEGKLSKLKNCSETIVGASLLKTRNGEILPNIRYSMQFEIA
jgi:hypothetical protein